VPAVFGPQVRRFTNFVAKAHARLASSDFAQILLDETHGSSWFSLGHLERFFLSSSFYELRVATRHLCFITPEIVDCYIPNPIKTLAGLYLYARLIGLSNIRTSIEAIDAKFYDEEKIFVSFLIKRPCKIIGSNLKIEFLNFLINKDRKRKGKKSVSPECIVEMLVHINDKSTLLLQKLSGTVNAYKDNNRFITFLRCGSPGSKIALHLARNGNDSFLCIDNDCFLSHNNAHLALLAFDFLLKADSLSAAIRSIGNATAIAEDKSAFNVDYSTSMVIIDTTASLSVRNFLLEN
jgi:hypothetical protein